MLVPVDEEILYALLDLEVDSFVSRVLRLSQIHRIRRTK